MRTSTLFLEHLWMIGRWRRTGVLPIFVVAVTWLLPPAPVPAAAQSGPSGFELQGTITVTVSGRATMKEEGDSEPLTQVIHRAATQRVAFSGVELAAGRQVGASTFPGKVVSFAASVNDMTTGAGPRVGRTQGECGAVRDPRALRSPICTEGAVSLVLLPGGTSYGFTFNSIVVQTEEQGDSKEIRVPGLKVGPIPLPREPWPALSSAWSFDIPADDRLGYVEEPRARGQRDEGVLHLRETARMRDGVYGWVPLKVAVTWNLERPEEKVEITLLEQEGGPRTRDPKQVVFQNGVLRIRAEAKVNPASQARSLRWQAPAVGSSQPAIQSEVLPDGIVRASIAYEGLPAQNDSFGNKSLRAVLGDRSDEKPFQVFFGRDGTDNPQSRGKSKPEPNWYVYWKQGPVPELGEFEYSSDRSMAGGYDPIRKTLTITSEGPGLIPGQDVLLVTKDKAHSYRLQRERCESIRAVAAIVRHELKHKELHEMQGYDYDQDRVTDEVETRSGSPWLDPFQPNTYENFNANLFYPNLSMSLNECFSNQQLTQQMRDHCGQLLVKGDNELLAIIAEGRKVAQETQDWAFPGSQAKRP